MTSHDRVNEIYSQHMREMETSGFEEVAAILTLAEIVDITARMIVDTLEEISSRTGR